MYFHFFFLKIGMDIRACYKEQISYYFSKMHEKIFLEIKKQKMITIYTFLNFKNQHNKSGCF